MKSLFVSYETAKLIDDQFSFNKNVIATYDSNKVLNLFDYEIRASNQLVAPTAEQVVDWIAEEYQIEIATTSWKKEGTKDEIIWVYSIQPLGKPNMFRFKETFASRIEALKTAINIFLNNTK